MWWHIDIPECQIQLKYQPEHLDKHWQLPSSGCRHMLARQTGEGQSRCSGQIHDAIAPSSRWLSLKQRLWRRGKAMMKDCCLSQTPSLQSVHSFSPDWTPGHRQNLISEIHVYIYDGDEHHLPWASGRLGFWSQTLKTRQCLKLSFGRKMNNSKSDVCVTFMSSTNDGKLPIDMNVRNPPTKAIHPALPCQMLPSLPISSVTNTPEDYVPICTRTKSFKLFMNRTATDSFPNPQNPAHATATICICNKQIGSWFSSVAD